MTDRLMEYFNRQPRLGIISTSNRNGAVDCAVYGSPQMIESGPKLEEYRSRMAGIVGEQAAGMIAVLAIFEVTEVRPLVDFGQDWEKSI
ncbi:MAG TPA: hypothetical protein PKV33_07780 [Methanothrix sp.]|nr:hypothetical protein [Methanothrix sp.]